MNLDPMMKFALWPTCPMLTAYALHTAAPAAPVTVANRQGLEIDERSAAKLKASADELLEERELALQCIKEAAAAAAAQ
jgi:hypothetical protein